MAVSKVLLMVTQLLQNHLYLDHSTHSRGDGSVEVLLIVTQLLRNHLYLDHSAHSRGDGGVKGVADGDPVVAEPVPGDVAPNGVLRHRHHYSVGVLFPDTCDKNKTVFLIQKDTISFF
jgi:hypothetical protein